jgi:hypothetical protein
MLTIISNFFFGGGGLTIASLNKYLREKRAKILAVVTQTTTGLFLKKYHNISFHEKSHIFCHKLVKIAENSDHNNDRTNPTIVSYNASVVKINQTAYIGRLKYIPFYLRTH